MFDNEELRMVAYLYYSNTEGISADDGDYLIDREECEKILKANNIIGWDFNKKEYIKGNHLRLV